MSKNKIPNVIYSISSSPSSSSSSSLLSFSYNILLLLFLSIILIFQHTIIIIDAENKIIDNNHNNNNITSINNNTKITDSNYTNNDDNNKNNSIIMSKTSLNNNNNNNNNNVENNENYHQQQIDQQYEKPQIHIIERQQPTTFIERRSDARGKFVSQIVNRASQAFQNLIEHHRNRPRPRLSKLLSERRSSSGRLFPRVREHFVHRFENFKSKSFPSLPSLPQLSPPPLPSLPSISSSSSAQSSETFNENDVQLPTSEIQYAESRIDGNETISDNFDDKQQFSTSPSPSASPFPPSSSYDMNDYKQPNLNYEYEGQKLRQDIVNKVGHLQNILETAFHVSRERRDHFLNRLLHNTNNRLERAKQRADQILSEPATSELAVRTLHHINQGINNANLFLHNLLNRIDVSIKVQMKNPDQHNKNNGTSSTSQTIKNEQQQQQKEQKEKEKDKN